MIRVCHVVQVTQKVARATRAGGARSCSSFALNPSPVGNSLSRRKWHKAPTNLTAAFTTSNRTRSQTVSISANDLGDAEESQSPMEAEARPRAEHAVISTFDLFSIGVGPSSSHTVGPMRAGKIFVKDLADMNMLDKVETLKVTLYGSLAATGKGHMTPQAVMMGLEGSDPETVETSTINSRYDSILQLKRLQLAGTHTIHYDMDRDMVWRMEPLPTHPNGIRFSVFDKDGNLMATNEYFSVGGGFVVNDQTQVDENLYYRSINKDITSHARRDQTHGLGGKRSMTDNTKELPSPETSSVPSKPTESSWGPTSNHNDNTHETSGDKLRQPPYLFRNAQGLLNMTHNHNLTIAQLVWNNELSYMTSEQISNSLLSIWAVMDTSIHDGVSSKEEVLPGRLAVRRRAPGLYRRLFKGFYPSISSSTKNSLPPPSIASNSPSTPPAQPALPGKSSSETASGSSISIKDGFNSPPPRSKNGAPLVIGDFEHDLPVVPHKNTVFPGIDFLSCYAIAVNEVNAGGGRVVTAPTNGAAGVIPAVLKYFIEFISDNPDRDVKTFLLTAAAVGMLYKRGATISAAEGGCMAEVGVASSMAASGFAACMGGTPSQILQAAEIGIEHSLGLTCDPIDGLVQVPCIERNSLGAVKAVTAAQLALAGDGVHSVSLDEAIEAMRVTARDMHNHYKETSLSGLATTVRIPLSSPAC